MNKYIFLQTKVIGGREFAYLLDEIQGIVIRVPVRSFTETRPKEDEIEEEFVERPLARVRRVVREPVFEDEIIEDDVLKAKPNVKVDMPAKIPRVMPPGMDAIFKKPEAGGHIETRGT